MKIGVSLPVRELGNDIDLIVEFAQAAEELGLTICVCRSKSIGLVAGRSTNR